MNQRRMLALAIASFGLIAASPAFADRDTEFLREMARTDGDPFGVHAALNLSADDRAKASKKEAAEVEVARADANAQEPASEKVAAKQPRQ